ncbi:hypothetical protein D9615_006678 [Tricholomella constricta]|uniref:CN hydrolase domain-containing protein n=1 Tax=Tricholomella constricta TaxID=117010 RepID=A0A8H5H6V8_9AGAR|nr:hypothetical protein D9615_006678 [Tricholomella constricta]
MRPTYSQTATRYFVGVQQLQSQHSGNQFNTARPVRSTFTRIFRDLRSGMTIPTPRGVGATATRTPLRIAVVQFCPKFGQVEANIAKAPNEDDPTNAGFNHTPLTCSVSLKWHSPVKYILLTSPIVLYPRTSPLTSTSIASGYVFDSAKAIAPYLEEPRTGPTSQFCQEIAKTLGCYVAGGYPERLGAEERASSSEAKPGPELDAEGVSKGSLAGGMEIPPVDGALDVAQAHSSDTLDAVPTKVLPRVQVGANSAVIYGPSGEWVGGYRKTNLYETDMTWAKPGTGFATFSLPLAQTPSSSPLDAPNSDVVSHKLDITLGICMDLNPHPPAMWTSSTGPFELADHCAKNRSRVLVLLNAWLFSGLGEDGELQNYDKEDEEEQDKDSHGDADEGHEVSKEEVDDGRLDDSEPDWYTLRYWTARLRPLWRRDGRRRGSNETVVSGSTNGSEGNEEEAAEQAVEDEDEDEKPPHETLVVVCNRTGKENGKIFAGSSAIFSMRAGSGRPKLLDMMGRREEGVRVWNLLV